MYANDGTLDKPTKLYLSYSDLSGVQNVSFLLGGDVGTQEYLLYDYQEDSLDYGYVSTIVDISSSYHIQSWDDLFN